MFNRKWLIGLRANPQSRPTQAAASKANETEDVEADQTIGTSNAILLPKKARLKA